MSDNFKVPNLVRGLKIIEYLSRQKDPRTITEIGTALDLPLNSVMRIVNALAHYGYLDRDPRTKTCRLTRKMLAIASRMPREKTLVETSLNAMKAVRDEYGETVLLSVLDRTRGVIIEQVQGTHPFRFVCEPGTEQLLHSSASTKSLIALLSADDRRELLREHDFERFTETTITERGAFDAELEEIRARGYAFDQAEQVEGVRCVAAAIRDHRGEPVAAITITGPSNRLRSKTQMNEIGAFVSRQAAAVSRELGYEPQPALA